MMRDSIIKDINESDVFVTVDPPKSIIVNGPEAQIFFKGLEEGIRNAFADCDPVRQLENDNVRIQSRKKQFGR